MKLNFVVLDIHGQVEICGFKHHLILYTIVFECKIEMSSTNNGVSNTVEVYRSIDLRNFPTNFLFSSHWLKYSVVLYVWKNYVMLVFVRIAPNSVAIRVFE